MENAATHFGSMTQLLTEYNRFLLLNWVVEGSLGTPASSRLNVNSSTKNTASGHHFLEFPHHYFEYAGNSAVNA